MENRSSSSELASSICFLDSVKHHQSDWQSKLRTAKRLPQSLPSARGPGKAWHLWLAADRASAQLIFVWGTTPHSYSEAAQPSLLFIYLLRPQRRCQHFPFRSVALHTDLYYSCLLLHIPIPPQCLRLQLSRHHYASFSASNTPSCWLAWLGHREDRSQPQSRMQVEWDV